MGEKLIGQNISSYEKLAAPHVLCKELPLSQQSISTVLGARSAIRNVMDGADGRKILLCGPCSIHSVPEALEYAHKLHALQKKAEGTFVILMRTYFEKPRTAVGWKGFVHDPDLDGSSNLSKGLVHARKLLLEITKLGLPTTVEALDPMLPQYYFDLVSYASIGARTVESQTHRELASGLSMPVGMKNATTGDVDIAINAIKAAAHPHSFIGINEAGELCRILAKGNKYANLILRGGAQPNYDSAFVKSAQEKLRAQKLKENVIIDCSHANSGKNHANQPMVFENVVNQIAAGNNKIIGLMLESNLEESSQGIPKDLRELKKGVSITDACIGWQTTEKIVLAAHEKLKGSMT
ncbi:3-deoxy-7-phosphoheptulonate synthase [Candidatus Micrarchaeota archaeon]|nr:3-deoxy-7-phosphoheptulonate synthase [Candidatus Micrarchaeota archaeon]